MSANSGAYGCARCDNRWGGLRTAHCTACHRTFTSVTAFDTHRDVDYRRPAGAEGACINPLIRGLVLNDAGYWGVPK